MTPISIRAYDPSDKKTLIHFMQALQDYLVEIDPLNRLRRFPDGGEAYTAELLKKIKPSGKIFIATKSQKLVGVIGVVVRKKSAISDFGGSPKPSGEVVELFVLPEERRGGIGKKLMQAAEAYCRTQGCDAMNLEVFAPNSQAYQFYRDGGYQDRSLCLLKIL